MDGLKFEANLHYGHLCYFLEYNQNYAFLYCLIILLHLISSFLHTRSLLVPYGYVSFESVLVLKTRNIQVYS